MRRHSFSRTAAGLKLLQLCIGSTWFILGNQLLAGSINPYAPTANVGDFHPRDSCAVLAFSEDLRSLDEKIPLALSNLTNLNKNHAIFTKKHRKANGKNQLTITTIHIAGTTQDGVAGAADEFEASLGGLARSFKSVYRRPWYNLTRQNAVVCGAVACLRAFSVALPVTIANLLVGKAVLGDSISQVYVTGGAVVVGLILSAPEILLNLRTAKKATDVDVYKRAHQEILALSESDEFADKDLHVVLLTTRTE